MVFSSCTSMITLSSSEFSYVLSSSMCSSSIWSISASDQSCASISQCGSKTCVLDENVCAHLDDLLWEHKRGELSGSTGLVVALTFDNGHARDQTSNVWSNLAKHNCLLIGWQQLQQVADPCALVENTIMNARELDLGLSIPPLWRCHAVMTCRVVTDPSVTTQ